MALFPFLVVCARYWPQLYVSACYIVEEGFAAAREGKPQCTSTFQASSCITFANVTLAKVSCRAKSRFKEWRASFRLNGKNSKLTVHKPCIQGWEILWPFFTIHHAILILNSQKTNSRLEYIMYLCFVKLWGIRGRKLAFGVSQKNLGSKLSFIAYLLCDIGHVL